MSKIQVNDLNHDSAELRDLSDREHQIQGGVIPVALAVVWGFNSFVGGYSAGMALRYHLMR